MNKQIALDELYINLPEDIVNFINRVKLDCSRLGVDIQAYRYGDLLIDEVFVNGYFSDEEKILAFSVKEDDMGWLGILVHEYGHMLQWANRRKFWNSCTRYHSDLWYWMDGKNYSNKKLTRSLKGNIMIEWDNEKQSVNLINKFGLNKHIDVEQYTQRATAYVLFYHIVRTTKKFYDKGHEPYNLPEIYEKMPKAFNVDLLDPPSELLDVLRKVYC